jgi:hypothetical protein
VRGLEGPEVLARTLPQILALQQPVDWHFFAYDDFTETGLPYIDRLKRGGRRTDEPGSTWQQRIHAMPQATNGKHRANPIPTLASLRSVRVTGCVGWN